MHHQLCCICTNLLEVSLCGSHISAHFATEALIALLLWTISSRVFLQQTALKEKRQYLPQEKKEIRCVLSEIKTIIPDSKHRNA